MSVKKTLSLTYRYTKFPYGKGYNFPCGGGAGFIDFSANTKRLFFKCLKFIYEEHSKAPWKFTIALGPIISKMSATFWASAKKPEFVLWFLTPVLLKPKWYL